MYNIEQKPSRFNRPRVFIYAVVFLATYFVYPAVDYARPTNWVIPAVVAMLCGITAGGVCVSLVWAVLGPRVWWVRMAEGFGLIAIQCILFPIGILLVEHDVFEGLFASSLFFPLAFLVGLIPILGYRAVTGTHLQMPWKDLSEGKIASSSNARQFELRHILIAMTLVAVAFGLASFGVSSFRIVGDALVGVLRILVGFGMILLFVLAYVGFGAIPCTSAAWRIRRAAMGFGFVVGWAGLLTILFLAISTIIIGRLPPQELHFVCYSLHFSLIGTLYYSVKILQVGGYVLASSHGDRS